MGSSLYSEPEGNLTHVILTYSFIALLVVLAWASITIVSVHTWFSSTQKVVRFHLFACGAPLNTAVYLEVWIYHTRSFVTA